MTVAPDRVNPAAPFGAEVALRAAGLTALAAIGVIVAMWGTANEALFNRQLGWLALGIASLWTTLYANATLFTRGRRTVAVRRRALLSDSIARLYQGIGDRVATTVLLEVAVAATEPHEVELVPGLTLFHAAGCPMIRGKATTTVGRVDAAGDALRDLPRPPSPGSVVKDFLTFVTLGIADGSVYAIAGLGLVLTFKSSGIFNFAHGAQGASAAYLMYTFREQQGLPWPIAALLAILIAGVLGGLVLERLANLLAGESTATRVVAMVGVLVGINTLLSAIYGPATLPFKPFLSTETVRFASINITYFRLIVVGLAILAAVGLSILFRRARIGTAMQAVVDDPVLLDLLGTSPVRARRFAWVLGSVFASISGLLLATFIGLNPDQLTLLVVFSFGAAAVGAFSSLPLTYVGGLVLGLGQAMTQGYLADDPTFAQLPPNVPFVVLVIALLVAPKRLLVERGIRAVRIEEPLPSYSRRTVTVAFAAATGALLLVPVFVDFNLPLWTRGLALVPIFVSLSLLVRTSGQVSLCQMAFAAVGSSTFAIVLSHGVPWGMALLIGATAAVPIGALVAIPAIRLRGVFLAVITLGFGILLERVFFTTALMFGTVNNRPVSRPALSFLDLTSDEAYYYLTLAIAGAVCALAMAIRRGRLGRLLQGLSASPELLEANGSSTNTTRLIAFCVSAGMAGIGGALLAGVTETTGGLTFNFSISLLMVAVLFVAGRSPSASALIAAALYGIALPYLDNPTVQKYAGVAFGAAAVIVTTRLIPVLIDRLDRGERSRERIEHAPVPAPLVISEAT